MLSLLRLCGKSYLRGSRLDPEGGICYLHIAAESEAILAQ
jgi:hypothetical protein